jgi:anti-sigma B factor antagonist
LTSEVQSNPEVAMSPTVVFPDFSAHREGGVAQAFVCTLQAGDVGPAWVHVAGDLDISSASRLERALRHTDTPPRLVVLDLRELTFLDCSGVEVIVNAAIRARRARRRLVVLRGPAEVDRVLALAGATDALEIVDLDAVGPPDGALPWFARTDDAA